MSDNTPTRGRGRPTKYNPDLLPQIEKLCSLYGSTDAQLAEFLDVNPDTINEWKNKYPEFSDTLSRAKDVANSRVERALYERAIGYSHPAVKIFIHEGCPVEAPYTEHYPPDTRACESWLQNRDPERWKNRQQVEHSGKIQVVPALRIKGK